MFQTRVWMTDTGDAPVAVDHEDIAGVQSCLLSSYRIGVEKAEVWFRGELHPVLTDAMTKEAFIKAQTNG